MASGNDMNAHENSYSGFISMLKIGTIASVIVGAIVILIIAS
jgi:hypothetical protein